jgi:hypothetical protein
MDAKFRLKLFRKALGLSQAELAFRLKRHKKRGDSDQWSEFTICKVEKGERGPGPDLIAAIWALTVQHSNDERIRAAGLRPITLWDWI